MKNFKKNSFVFFGIIFFTAASVFIATNLLAQTQAGIDFDTTASASVCGSANGGAFSEPPKAETLCLNGTAKPDIPGFANNQWLWYCSNAIATVKCGASFLIPASKQIINGACGLNSSDAVRIAPSGAALCAAGTSGEVKTTSEGWSWFCLGANGGDNAQCQIKKSVTITQVVTNGECGASNGKTFSTAPASGLCLRGAATNVLNIGDKWNWKCEGINGGAVANCAAGKTASITSSTTNPSTATSKTETTPTYQSGSFTQSSPVVEEKNISEEQVSASTSNVVKEDVGEVICGAANGWSFENVPSDNTFCMNGFMTDFKTLSNGWAWKCTVSGKEVQCGAGKTAQLQNFSREISVQQQQVSQKIILESLEKVQPAVPEVRDGKSFESPKQAGEIDWELKVEHVGMVEQAGAKKVALVGKAQPETFITIFVYSEDPVVITVKADKDGNWHYALDKELADGEHEVYVAVTDEEGKVMKKSEPLAFVKTAQAATAIASERIGNIENNKSPLQRAGQSFLAVGVVIIMVFFALALTLIGVLTHKHNGDEEIS